MRKLFFPLTLAIFATVVLAQVTGGTGRTQGARNSGTSSFAFSPGLGTITCSGATCTGTSGISTPGSQVVSGMLHFTSAMDAHMTVGGSSGGGAGLFQVSCDAGGTWLTISACSGTAGGGTPSCSYNVPGCTGPVNTNTLQYRTTLTGAGSVSLNMALTAPSTASVAW